MADPYFHGVMGKRTKKAIRDQAQAVAKLRKRLDAAQRKRLKAYEERKRKGQHEAESEQPDFGADDDGWIDARADSPPPPLKTMRQLLNQNSDKLHPAELVHTYKQSQKGVTELINQMKYESIQGTKAAPTILHLIRRGYWSYTCHRPGVAFSIRMLAAYHAQVVSGVTSAENFAKGFGVRLREKYLVNQLLKLAQPFRDAYNHWVSIDQECRLDFDKSVLRNDLGFVDPANLCPACFAPDISEPEPLGYLSVDGNFQLKRRTRASDGEEDVPASIRLFNCTEEALGYALGKPSNSAMCRHGHIIRFRNLFTTGESAKEIAWLLKCIHRDTPGVKRWALTYDVACAMDKAFKIFALNEGMTLHTAVNRFHLHAHEYSCQVVYNPMLQLNVFGMTDGESIETAWSSNSHLVRLTRTAGKNSRMQLLQSHAEHHAAQAKLKRGTRLCSRYSDMSRKLVKLRHRFQLTGYSEDKVTTSLAAEKEYCLSKPASASQQYLELL
ncbi:hypothetical protein V1506DRAFT_506552 [Lipomyces tetrasporus]